MIRTMTVLTLAGLLTSGALMAVITAKNVEERGLREVIAGHEGCAQAVGGSDLTASAARCSNVVAHVHRQAIQATICDQALIAADTFVIRTSCPTSVKTLLAQRDVALGERDAANLIATRLIADQAAVITRAEARGFNQAQRIQSAQNDLAAAPRTDAGLGRCDADCLRRLGRTD